jgi:hypothetical protein
LGFYIVRTVRLEAIEMANSRDDVVRENRRTHSLEERQVEALEMIADALVGIAYEIATAGGREPRPNPFDNPS